MTTYYLVTFAIECVIAVLCIAGPLYVAPQD